MVDNINPHIKTNLNINIDRWERFEELADEHTLLWEVFWGISNDKDKIKERDVCAIVYFHKFILPALDNLFSQLLLKNKLSKDDVEIVLSLYIKLIPQDVCKECDCAEKISTNTVFNLNDTY